MQAIVHQTILFHQSLGVQTLTPECVAYQCVANVVKQAFMQDAQDNVSIVILFFEDLV